MGKSAAEFVRDHADTQRLAADPDAAALIEAMKSQLLIVLVNRLGGRVDVPVADVDGTGGWNLEMLIDHETRTFTFVTRKKN